MLTRLKSFSGNANVRNRGRCFKSEHQHFKTNMKTQQGVCSFTVDRETEFVSLPSGSILTLQVIASEGVLKIVRFYFGQRARTRNVRGKVEEVSVQFHHPLHRESSGLKQNLRWLTLEPTAQNSK